MKRINIIISSGHSLSDPGAVNKALGVTESQLTIEFKGLLVKALKCFEMTSTVDIDTETNSQFQNRLRKEDTTSTIVEIHFNSSSNPKATGTEVVVSKHASRYSMDLARAVGELVSKTLGLRNRGILLDSQTPRGRIGIVNLKNPAILIELGFISNPSDVEAYNTNKKELAFELIKLLYNFESEFKR